MLKVSDKASITTETASKLSIIKNEHNDKAIVFVGAGTCGLGAGAAKTIAKAKAYLSEKQIDAEVIPVGCIGLCSSEPIMDIKLPGKKRISFEKVTEADVANILDHVFTIEVPEHPVLGQFSEQEDQMDWADVPALKDHFFFKPQLRLVLENCGITNPTSIEEYIARDGYKAYLDAIKKIQSC